jgi:ComF family protein
LASDRGICGQYIEPVRYSDLLGSPLSALRSLLPTQCAVCRAWDRQRLCSDCITRFAAPTARCQRCALTLPGGATLCGACLRDPPPFDQAITVGDYAYPWDALISRFKFNDALDLAETLARALLDAIVRVGGPLPHLVLPVPLSPARLQERGYNQAWELARRIARPLGCRSDAKLLLCVKETVHQRVLPRLQRASNVRGAYLVEPRHSAQLRGADVAIVDDVLTTGATAAEVARVLKQAGAARVRLWVVARTASH